MIYKILKGEVVMFEVMKFCDVFKKCECVFKVLIMIIFDNDGLEFYIIIEVDICDCSGFLFDLMCILVNSNIYIVFVVIVIYGE